MRMSKIHKTLVCLTICFFLSACQSATTVGRAVNAGCDIDDFVKLDAAAMWEKFTQCDPDQQIELYLYYLYSTYPPGLINNAKYLARSGKALIPSLLSRLEKRDHLEDELYKPDLLYVFYHMQRRGYYDVAGDSSLMTRIKRAVDQMTTDHIKDWALDIVSDIESANDS